MENTAILTYRYRVKDKHAARLNRMAKAVNYVWNYANEVQKHALKWGMRWPSHFDLVNLTSGSSKLLGVQSDTIGEVCKRYVQSRKKKPYLRYRGKKSLGWVPFRGRCFNDFLFFGTRYDVWLSRKLPDGAKVLDGSSFSQDATGRWYLNLVLESPVEATDSKESVGIDLGLKDLATLSTGQKIAAPRIFRNTQARLAKAQRARKKRQVKKIHAKIANQRRDFLHKISTGLTRKYGHIVVGNVSSGGLAKTKMAKSVLDAGWYMLKRQLAYKCDYAGARFTVVNEAYTTQACSECGSISGPQGRKGLKVGEWQCVHCGTFHDRDVNAAKNILRIGQDTPFAGAA